MKVEERIKALGLSLPVASPPGALYVAVKEIGNVLFVSGQVPMKDGKPVYTGKVGKERSIEYAQEAAGIANKLAEVAPPQIIRVVQAGDVQLIDEAVLSLESVAPNTKLNTLIGAMIGIVLAAGVILAATRGIQLMNRVDFHTHVLPGIDDGRQSESQSYRMLKMEKNNGVAIVVAMPHFYPDGPTPTESIKTRTEAYEKL